METIGHIGGMLLVLWFVLWLVNLMLAAFDSSLLDILIRALIVLAYVLGWLSYALEKLAWLASWLQSAVVWIGEKIVDSRMRALRERG